MRWGEYQGTRLPRVLCSLFYVQCGVSGSLCSYGLTGSHCSNTRAGQADQRSQITWCNAVPAPILLIQLTSKWWNTSSLPTCSVSPVGQNMIAAAASVWTNSPRLATFHHDVLMFWCCMMQTTFSVLTGDNSHARWGGLSNIEFKNYRLATPVIRLLFRLLAVTSQGLLIQTDAWLHGTRDLVVLGISDRREI